MSHDVDDPFYSRADAHIRLSNDQLAAAQASAGPVMYRSKFAM